MQDYALSADDSFTSVATLAPGAFTIAGATRTQNAVSDAALALGRAVQADCTKPRVESAYGFSA